MEKAENKSISLTESALARISNVMDLNEDLGNRFRVYITGGGCSGFNTDLSLILMGALMMML
jgi:Uncharacterized conserved protein